MVTWSQDDIDREIWATLLQIYPILLSTFLSIGRDQLSLFDANFTLNITSSPLTVYLVISSLSTLFWILVGLCKNDGPRKQIGLYRQIRSHHLITSVLGTLVLLLWFALSVTIRMSGSAFIDSSSCQGSTFSGWFVDFLQFVFFSIVIPGRAGFFPLLFFGEFLLLILVRRWPKIFGEIQSYLAGIPKLWKIFFAPWAFMKFIWYVQLIHGTSNQNLKLTRKTANKDHKWFIYCLFFWLDLSWSYRIISASINASEGYQLTYGQVCLPNCYLSFDTY